MAKIDEKYHKLVKYILDNGFKYEDPNRKGIHRIQIPNYQIEHNFKDGFPAITTKKLYWKGIVGELLFFLRGDTNIKYLVDNGINIWNKDSYNYYIKSRNLSSEKELNRTFPDNESGRYNFFLNQIKKGIKGYGDLGRIYGAQWRNWKGQVNPSFKDKKGFGSINTVFDKLNINYVDQISNLIKGLKENPMGTRHIVTAWNPAELDDMALPPCHWSFEILVEPLSTFDRCVIKTPTTTNKDIGSHAHYTINKWLDENDIPKYKFTLKWHQRSVDSFLGKM